MRLIFILKIRTERSLSRRRRGDPQWSPVCVPPQMTVKNMCSAHSISSRSLAIIFFSSRETYTWFLPIIRAVSLCVLSRKNL